MRNAGRAFSWLAIAALCLQVLAAQAAGAFTLASPAFSDGEILPGTFAGKGGEKACKGKNVSPPLRWKHPPKGTRSFAIAMTGKDVEGDGQEVVRWVVYGIPASTMSLAEGAGNRRSLRFRAGLNSFGAAGYAGPCPQAGNGARRYVIAITALDIDAKGIKPGLDYGALSAVTKRHRLATASLSVLYRSPGQPGLK